MYSNKKNRLSTVVTALSMKHTEKRERYCEVSPLTLMSLWSFSPGQCKAPVELPFTMLTVLMDQDEFPVGTTVKYKCSFGDYGSVLIRCLQNSISSVALKTTAHVTTVYRDFLISIWIENYSVLVSNPKIWINCSNFETKTQVLVTLPKV